MQRQPYKILLVEGNPAQAEVSKRYLSSSKNCSFHVEWVTSLADARSRLRDERFDAVLMDLALRDSTGIDSVLAIRRLRPSLPVVVLTAVASDDTAGTLLQHGVQDCLAKGSLTSDGEGAQALIRAIRYAIQRQRASHEIERLHKQAQTQQQQLDQQNTHLSKLNTVAQKVVENVSHEFRTPLTVIKEYVALLHEGVLGQVNDDQRRFLNIVADRAEDLNRMVDDMLDVGKLDAGLLTVRRQQCEIKDIIKHVLGNLTRKAAIRGVTLEVSLDEHLPSVFCDEDKAGRTIVNLATNAIKFAREHGRVCLAVRYDQRAQEIVVEVSDDGPGIQARDLQRIFDRFTQIDPELQGSSRGFGLGLGIARELVELNLGRISVSSQPGMGSCFSFTLPVADVHVVSRRFVEHLGRTKNVPATLAVCLFQTEEASTAQLDDFEPFLYVALHAGDLALRIDERVWMVFVAGDMYAYEKMCRRASKLLEDANRARAGMPLPSYTNILVGRWDSTDDVETILTEVASALPHATTPSAQPAMHG